MISPLAEGLLKTAELLLAGRGVGRPTQAQYRRAVSTAYYSVFHLLIAEASERMFPTTVRDKLAPLCARSVTHAHVSKVSKWFTGAPPPDHLKPVIDAAVFPVDLKAVAQQVVDLKQARITADYDGEVSFGLSDARVHVANAKAVFTTWKKIRNHDMAQLYLALIAAGEIKSHD